MDIAIGTGLDHGRNILVANADAVIAIGGGAGTLSEIAFAWMLKRLVIGVSGSGWADRLGGQKLDARTRGDGPDDQVFRAEDAAQAMLILKEKVCW